MSVYGLPTPAGSVRETRRVARHGRLRSGPGVFQPILRQKSARTAATNQGQTVRAGERGWVVRITEWGWGWSSGGGSDSSTCEQEVVRQASEAEGRGLF